MLRYNAGAVRYSLCRPFSVRAFANVTPGKDLKPVKRLSGAESTVHGDSPDNKGHHRRTTRAQGKDRLIAPHTRSDWKHLPEWRRQNLSIKHKLAKEAQALSSGDRDATATRKRELTQPQKAHWNPPKKLSPDAMAGIRLLHDRHPECDVPGLAKTFSVSPDVIRRILRSKWQPTAEEAAARDERWKKRKFKILEAQRESHGPVR